MLRNGSNMQSRSAGGIFSAGRIVHLAQILPKEASELVSLLASAYFSVATDQSGQDFSVRVPKSAKIFNKIVARADENL